MVVAALGGCSSASQQRAKVLKPADFVDRSPLRMAERDQITAVEIDGPPAPVPSAAAGETAVDGEAGSELLIGVDRSASSIDGGEGASLPADLAATDRTADKDAVESSQADSRAASARTATGAATASEAPASPTSRRSSRSAWVIDSLVGQINGRPIFADEFLDPIADRLRQTVEEFADDRVQSKRVILNIVARQFEDWVNNELIIAEAESLLSPEQKQGVLAFFKDFQEQEILQRGGNKAAAESSLQEQFGTGMQEFMRTKKNEALAGDLLRKRVRPRAIVSWRDIEREFQRAEASLNPGATIEIGRIALLTEADAGKIAVVKERLAAQTPFAEVATELGLEAGGWWMTEAIGPKGLDGLDLADEFIAALKPLEVGQVSPPIVQGRRTMWLCLISRDDPPPKSIFDPDVQLAIRQDLQKTRESEETNRYLTSLRVRWIQENIDEMRARLADIALQRYWN